METREIIQRVRKLELQTRKLVDEIAGGAYHSMFKGRGIEFNEVRDFQYGDDIRDIDWNVSARFGHPYVKQYTEERELVVILMVDVSASGDFGSRTSSKNQLSTELAALLAFSAIRNNDQVGLLLFSSQIELFVPPRKGKRHVLRLMRELVAFERKEKQTNISQALDFLMKVTSRKAIVFLISDLIDKNFNKKISVVGRKHDLITLRISDPAEFSLPRGGILTGCDPETNTTIFFPAFSKSARRFYKMKVFAEMEEQRMYFRRNGLDLLDLSTNNDFIKPLISFFSSRKKQRR